MNIKERDQIAKRYKKARVSIELQLHEIQQCIELQNLSLGNEDRFKKAIKAIDKLLQEEDISDTIMTLVSILDSISEITQEALYS